jgi:hypothetical protein
VKMSLVLVRVLVSAVLAGLMLVLPAQSASATVLVNAPRRTAVVNIGRIRVGVWYRTWDGGPRVYRVKVVNPRGHVIFERHGVAPTRWKWWAVTPHRLGTFRTIYRTKTPSGSWVRSVFRTYVRCGCR